LAVDQQSIWLGRVLSQLLSAGLTLTQSLTLASQIGGPHRLADTLQSVESGRPLHQSLPDSLPPLLVTMVAVGEESGNIPELLGRACDILEWNWESRVEGWLAIVEPLLLAALGLVAGLTVLAFSGPLTQLVQSLG
jgi:type II secretory pathway component PulF